MARRSETTPLRGFCIAVAFAVTALSVAYGHKVLLGDRSPQQASSVERAAPAVDFVAEGASGIQR